MLPGRMVSLTSNNVVLQKKDNISSIGFKTKEPKFVPYEPYKAAVNPIVPIPRHKGSRKSHVSSTLPSICTFTSTDKPRKESLKSCESSELEPKKENDECLPVVSSRDDLVGTDLNKEWEDEKKAMETEMQLIKDENAQLEIQLKFQAQVNNFFLISIPLYLLGMKI